jgi:hypothetical protein
MVRTPAGSSAVYGGLGGAIGAACMTVVRMAARRAGVIDKTVPQVMEEWASRRTGIEPPGGAAGHHVADHLLHLGFGLVMGVTYGLLFGRRRRGPIVRPGAAFGTGVWLFGSGVLLPLLGAGKPFWRAKAAENAINLSSHLLFGVVAATLTDELAAQPDRGPSSKARRHLTSTG